MYRGSTQTDYQNKHYNINQKDEGTLHDRGRGGGTKFILRIEGQETRLTLQEHDDDDDFIYIYIYIYIGSFKLMRHINNRCSIITPIITMHTK